MKSLLSAILFAGICFAQTATSPAGAEKPKERSKANCCASTAACCKGMMDKSKGMKDEMKKGGCCGGEEGAMCTRKAEKAQPASDEKK